MLFKTTPDSFISFILDERTNVVNLVCAIDFTSIINIVKDAQVNVLSVNLTERDKLMLYLRMTTYTNDTSR